MYNVSAQGVDERMINVHYYYYFLERERAFLSPSSVSSLRLRFYTHWYWPVDIIRFKSGFMQRCRKVDQFGQNKELFT